MNNRMSVSYWVARTGTHSVEVKAWFDKKWQWNIYAHIFPGHELYSDDQSILELPMPGGVTFDKEDTSKPLGGIKFDWQRESHSKVVGCDYGHIWDDYDNHPSPFDYPNGDIPAPFKGHADALLAALSQSGE